jgi:hypothetical protein
MGLQLHQENRRARQPSAGSTVRYLRSAGAIYRIRSLGHCCYSYVPAKRVPAAVRKELQSATGRTEVEFNTRTREARVLAFWEQVT